MRDHYSTDLADKLGRGFKVGDKVARPVKFGSRSVDLMISEVTKMTDKIYLDGSPIAIIYPGRLLIVTSIVEA